MIYIIQDYFYAFNWDQLLFFWKAASYLVSIMLFGGIVLLITKLNVLGKAIREASSVLTASSLPQKKLLKRWERIEKAFEAGDEANRKLAIIDADKLMDFILESLGYHGKSMGERLEKVNIAQFPWLNDVWTAHKVRNSIVHNSDYELSRDEAERALEIFKNVLRDLGVL